MNITSVLVISMLLCSRHNAAVLDELSCCPSVGVWVSMGGWLAGRPRWRTCSPLIWEQVVSQGDFTTWSMAWSPQLTARRETNYVTLIHLLRGLQSELKDLIILNILKHSLTVLSGGAISRQVNVHRRAWGNIPCQCDCPVFWWWLTNRPPCCPNQLS